MIKIGKNKNEMLETVILKKNITFLLFWYMKWCFELLMIGMQNRNTMYRFYNDYTKICVYKTMYKSMNMYMYCWWDINIPHKTWEILAFLTKVKRYQHSKSNIWNRVGFYDKCFTLIRNLKIYLMIKSCTNWNFEYDLFSSTF